MRISFNPFVVPVLTIINILFVLMNAPPVQAYLMELFELRTRSTVTWAPVASFRPLIDGQVMAVDAMPKGQANQHPDNGFSWFDACDSDIMDNNQSVTCARMGIKTDRVEFGSRNFNGAPPKDVYIVRDRQVIARFADDGLHVYGGVYAKNFYQE